MCDTAAGLEATLLAVNPELPQTRAPTTLKSARKLPTCYSQYHLPRVPWHSWRVATRCAFTECGESSPPGYGAGSYRLDARDMPCWAHPLVQIGMHLIRPGVNPCVEGCGIAAGKETHHNTQPQGLSVLAALMGIGVKPHVCRFCKGSSAGAMDCRVISWEAQIALPHQHQHDAW